MERLQAWERHGEQKSESMLPCEAPVVICVSWKGACAVGGRKFQKCQKSLSSVPDRCSYDTALERETITENVKMTYK